MAGRRSVWTNDKVLALSEKFVPVADEVWRLQRGSDPESRFFQEIAREGHYGGNHDDTRQGIYVVAPSGVLLASRNSNSAERIEELMQNGLDRWEALPDNQRFLPEGRNILASARDEERLPEDGMVLSVTSRDLRSNTPDPEGAKRLPWNRDNAWFHRDEVRAFVPDDVEVGQTWVPPGIERLARFHLIDTVRGQTVAFHTSSLKTTQWLAKAVEVTDDAVTIEITGRILSVAPAGPGGSRIMWQRGIKLALLGTATFDREKHEFTAFDVIAAGQRWGRTRFNGRGRRRGARGTDPSYVGFSIQLADDGPASQVPPAQLGFYDRSFAKR